jgi:MFS family permease
MNTDVRKATFFISMSKFISQTMLFFWGIYFTQIGLSGMQQGVLFAIFPIVSILSAIPIGLLNDRLSSKRIAMLGYALNGINFWLISLVGANFWALFAINAVGSFGVTMSNLSVDSIFYKTGDKKQNRQIGNYVGSYLFAAGLGVFIGGFILDSIPIELWLKIIGTFTLFIAALTVILPKTETFKFQVKEYRKDIFKLPVILFISMIFIWAVHMGAEITSYGLLLREDFGLDYRQMGTYMGTAIMAMLLWAKLAIHLIEKKWSILHILYLGLVLSAIGHIMMIVPRIDISLLGRFIHEAGDAFMLIFLYYGVRKLFPSERSGGMAGMVNFMQMSAIAAGALMFAPIGRAYNNSLPFIIGTGLCIIALILATRFSNLIKH